MEHMVVLVGAESGRVVVGIAVVLACTSCEVREPAVPKAADEDKVRGVPRRSPSGVRLALGTIELGDDHAPDARFAAGAAHPRVQRGLAVQQTGSRLVHRDRMNHPKTPR
jgi:hypothetical protein